MNKIKCALITILFVLTISSTAYSGIDKKGKVSSKQYMVQVKDGLNVDRKLSFYTFCIEGYKFYSFSGWGNPGPASQFFINIDGKSVPAKCDN